jgi:alpha-1,3-glucosyltransferase
MELTLHLPPREWYTYDLPYWGLDYPPLTAYHSLLLGWLGSRVNPAWFALHASRGLESPELLIYMRLTALATEALVFTLPAYLLSKAVTANPGERDFLLLLLLCHPTLAIIDHGHFQYNAAMLGFMLWTIYLFHRHRAWVLGSVTFCCSLLFKQMALFYALPVFFFLLGRCFSHALGSGKRRRGFLLLVQLGLTVVLTLGLALLPLLVGPGAGDLGTVLQVLHRIFPLQRGLYEDKVANFWCASNLLIRWRTLLSRDALALLSLGATLVTTLPSALLLLRFPTRKYFLYALLCSSLAFFLFAFQVHEKSILLPVLPACLLVLEEPIIVPWFVNVAMFS